jgi:hypothetical protein
MALKNAHELPEGYETSDAEPIFVQSRLIGNFPTGRGGPEASYREPCF